MSEQQFLRGFSLLREMFPFHAEETIEAILREHKGALDIAIPHLLRLPPDFAGPMPAPRTPADRHSFTAEDAPKPRFQLFKRRRSHTDYRKV
jgi:hypothetical protein